MASLVCSCAPKGPFSGSELAFALALPEGAAAAERAWDIAGAAQDALEPLIMVAAPVAIQLRIKGFTEQVSFSASAPCRYTMSRSGTQGNSTCHALLLHITESMHR